jgi:hypothetical protein
MYFANHIQGSFSSNSRKKTESQATKVCVANVVACFEVQDKVREKREKDLGRMNDECNTMIVINVMIID